MNSFAVNGVTFSGNFLFRSLWNGCTSNRPDVWTGGVLQSSDSILNFAWANGATTLVLSLGVDGTFPDTRFDLVASGGGQTASMTVNTALDRVGITCSAGITGLKITHSGPNWILDSLLIAGMPGIAPAPTPTPTPTPSPTPSPTPTPTTYTVSGTVTDGTSGGVLPNVTMTTTDSSNTTRTTMTNSGGQYSVSGMSTGTLTVTGSATSYQNASKTVTVSGNTTVDLVLQRVAAPAPAPTPTPTPTPMPLPAPQLPARMQTGPNTFTCSLSDIVHPASCVNSQFGNATAICGDGARSCSTTNQGTCSSHSSVYCWVCPGTLCPQ